MITRKENIPSMRDENEKGLTLEKLTVAPHKPEKVRLHARAILEPGGEVGFHVHEGETESYYILSGVGLYNDNGTETEVHPGDITFTHRGEGHGIKNAGDEDLHFIALVVLD